MNDTGSNAFFLGPQNTTTEACSSTRVIEVVRRFLDDITNGVNDIGLCVVIEDISRVLADDLAKVVDFPTDFFSNHFAPSPFTGPRNDLFAGLMSQLPSRVCSDYTANLHFQSVIALKKPGLRLDSCPYHLQTTDNAQRSVHPVLEYSGYVFALAAVCVSITRVKLVNGCWMCFILTDSDRADVESARGYPHPAATSTNSFRSTQVSYRALFPEHSPGLAHGHSSQTSQTRANHSPAKLSLEVCHMLASAKPGAYNAETSFVQLAQPAVSVLLEEWTCYSHCMGRCVKLHEPLPVASSDDIASGNIERNMIELFRWRRRSHRSLAKLQALLNLVDHPPNHFSESTLISRDIRFIITQIEQYRDLLEAMVPMLTSIIQIADSRRAMRETIYVKNLTYVALIFLPLGYVSSLLSINGDFAVNEDHFWVYFVVAVPLLVLVLAVSHYVPFESLLQVQHKPRRLAKSSS